MAKRSITAALLLTTGIFAEAADNFAAAFSEGKFDARLRAQYFFTDWDDNSNTGRDGKDPSGFAAGGSVIFRTAPVSGFRVGAGLYTTQNPGGFTKESDGATATSAQDLFAREGSSKTYGQGYAVLAKSYLQYDISKTKIKAGRFLMTNPWITPNDTKMIPLTVEGAQIVTSEFRNSTIQFDFAKRFKERGAAYFGNMADGADVPHAIRNNYATHYNPADTSHGEAPSVLIAGLNNKSVPGLKLQAWAMHWNNLVSQAMAEANYALEVQEVILGFGGRYVQQFDQGAGALIKPMLNHGDSDDSVDSSLWALRATADFRASKLLLSLSQTNSNGDMIAPWRGFLTQGYTRSMTITDWNANTKAYKAQFDYDFNEKVAGLNAFVSYSYYDRDPNRTSYVNSSNGDTHQLNLDLIYSLSRTFRGTELKARFMEQNNETTALYEQETSGREMRLEANYNF